MTHCKLHPVSVITHRYLPWLAGAYYLLFRTHPGGLVLNLGLAFCYLRCGPSLATLPFLNLQLYPQRFVIV
jgi:hypothetical protein